MIDTFGSKYQTLELEKTFNKKNISENKLTERGLISFSIKSFHPLKLQKQYLYIGNPAINQTN